MYHPHDRRLDPRVLERWRDYARRLGADKPAAASAMSNDLPTRALFGDDLESIFRTPWDYITVVALGASQQIVAHRDRPLAGNLRRFHIPFLTNPGCWVYHWGLERDPHGQQMWQKLEKGRVYEMDPAGEHGAVNWGGTVRLHLLIDCPGLLPNPREPELPDVGAEGGL